MSEQHVILGLKAELKQFKIQYAALQSRIEQLENGLIKIRKSTEIMEARRIAAEALKREVDRENLIKRS